MDVGSDYVAMCEKAEEIQKLWKPRIGDIVLWSRGTTPIVMDEELSVSSASVWLPRQDELQEMLRGDGTISNPRRTALVLFASLVFFVDRLTLEYRIRLISGEQLWLAFVMSEKYGKYWDTEEGNWELIPQKEMREKYLANWDGKVYWDGDEGNWEAKV